MNSVSPSVSALHLRVSLLVDWAKALLVTLLVVCAAWALPAAFARAASEVIVLDDSRTYTDPANAQMQWRRQSAGSDTDGMEALIRVNVYINTADYVGRSGRVYLVMPTDDNAPVEATWTGKGFLKDGQVTSGERTLVFAGRIAADALSDQFTMRLRTGTDWRSNQRRIRMRFELELD